MNKSTNYIITNTVLAESAILSPTVTTPGHALCDCKLAISACSGTLDMKVQGLTSGKALGTGELLACTCSTSTSRGSAGSSPPFCLPKVGSVGEPTVYGCTIAWPDKLKLHDKLSE